MSNDPFHLHKVALRPLLRTVNSEETTALFKTLESLELDEFVAFLYRQGLAQLWLQFLLKQESLPPRYENTIKSLKDAAKNTAINQLMQRKVLVDTRNAFNAAGIEYLVFKGVQLRHTLYLDPIHRTVCDIDILVPDEQKLEAVKALLKAGFSAHHSAENISHETSLVKNSVSIDLHWHLMRPGRTRLDLNDYLFSQRQQFSVFEEKGFEGLSNEASLLVMLVHPAITKYVNGEASSLRHLVDVHRLTQQKDINWDSLIRTLNKSGTRTAAWASLKWFQMLAEDGGINKLANQLKPGGLKTTWLSYWMGRDLNTKLANQRLITRVGFSLMLQDRPKDVFRALSTLRNEKRKSAATLKALEQLD